MNLGRKMAELYNVFLYCNFFFSKNKIYKILIFDTVGNYGTLVAYTIFFADLFEIVFY